MLTKTRRMLIVTHTIQLNMNTKSLFFYVNQSEFHLIKMQLPSGNVPDPGHFYNLGLQNSYWLSCLFGNFKTLLCFKTACMLRHLKLSLYSYRIAFYTVFWFFFVLFFLILNL